MCEASNVKRSSTHPRLFGTSHETSDTQYGTAVHSSNCTVYGTESVSVGTATYEFAVCADY